MIFRKNNILKIIFILFSLELIFVLGINVDGKEYDIAASCVVEKNFVINNPKEAIEINVVDNFQELIDINSEYINFLNSRNLASGKIIYQKST